MNITTMKNTVSKNEKAIENLKKLQQEYAEKIKKLEEENKIIQGFIKRQESLDRDIESMFPNKKRKGAEAKNAQLSTGEPSSTVKDDR